MRAPTNWCGTTCARCRRAMPQSSGGDPALLEVGALRTRLLLASDVTEAYACVPLAHVVECRADQQVVLDDSFIPTVLHARTARPAGVVYQRAARAAPSARRSARRAGRGDRPGRRRRVRRLPDAAGDQSLRAAAGALRRVRASCIRRACFRSACRRRASWRRSPRRRNGRRSSRPIGTIICGSRSTR